MANEIIRPSALETERASPVASEFLVTDNGTNVAKVTIEKAVKAGRPAASKSEAETGSDSNKVMTPLTVQQKIDYEIGKSLASKAQGDKADTAVQPNDLGAVATSNDYDDLDNKPTLGTAAAEDVGAFATATQGGKADTAWQPATVLPSPSLGDWDGATAYLVNDRVFHNGNYWIAKADNTNSEPEEGDDWTLFLPGVSVEDGSIAEPKYATGSVSERALADDTLRLINGPKKPKVEKWGMFADWQAVPDPALGVDDSPQVITQRALMDTIALNHPDLDYASFLGDLVETATDHTTGAAPLYGYPELLKDFNERMPLSWGKVFPLAGNHDRDGTGLNLFREAWGYTTYKEQIGPLYHYSKKGNTVRVYMGDMGGSNSGEIIDFVVEWFRLVVQMHKTCNIFVHLHQPISGTYYGSTNAGTIQRYSQRLIDVIEATDNIAYVGYGHVGTDMNGCCYSSEHYGTLHINFQTGIPTSFSAPRDNPYSIMIMEAGSSTVKIERWNGTTGEHMATRDLTVPLKYPIDLGGNEFEHDGRSGDSGGIDFSTGPKFQYVSIADTRTGSGSSWSVSAEVQWLDQKAIGRDAQSGAPVGLGFGTLYHVPGGENDSSEGTNQNSIPAYGPGGGHAVTRLASDNLDYAAEYSIWARQDLASGDALQKVVAIRSGSSVTGLDLKLGSYFMDGAKVIDENRHMRLRAYTAAELSNLTLVPSSPQGQVVYCTNGNAGQPCLAVSRGGSGGWSRIVLGALVSAT